MKRDWKPGDVAMVGMTRAASPLTHTPENAAELVETPCAYSHGFWVALADSNCMWNAVTRTRVRPLVVIDSEDREQAAAVLSAYGSQVHARLRGEDEPDDWRVDRMQAALRDLADPKPPKPEEPTGKWAVVEDKARVTWCRAGFAHPNGHWNKIGLDVWADYCDIDAVEVLSQGVTP